MTTPPNDPSAAEAPAGSTGIQHLRTLAARQRSLLSVLEYEVADFERRIEYMSDRQLAQQAFQNLDQKQNQILNMLYTVLKLMNEARTGPRSA